MDTLKKIKLAHKIKPRDIEIYELRKGYFGKPKTLRRIGKVFDLSAERIRQIEESVEKVIKEFQNG